MVQFLKTKNKAHSQSLVMVALSCLIAHTSPVFAQQLDNSTLGKAELSLSNLADEETALDLTVLSTSEDNVSFVIIEQTDNDDDRDNNTDDAAGNETPSDTAQPDDQTDDQADDQADDLAGDQAGDQLDNSSAVQQEGAVDNETIGTQSQTVQADTAPAITGRMTRVDAKDVGLASIGIGNQNAAAYDSLDNRLWRGIDLKRALMLIEEAPVPLAAVSLRDMSYQVVARQGVPPTGAAENPAALLLARLAYLAKAGRSDAIAAIITQLPKEQMWQEWHIWKLFYDLMRREDQEACDIAQQRASGSLEPLWQKTNLMCQVLTGDTLRAAFSADVLKASGLIDDALYFDLIDLLLGRKSSVEVPDTAVDLTHIILMDAAHINMSAVHLSQLPASYFEAANALRYLSPDARQSLGLSNLRAGLTDQDKALALFVASAQQDDTALKAMSRRLAVSEELSADSAAVQLYVALRDHVSDTTERSADEALELAELIIQALRLEVADGNGRLWLGFYAPLLSEAMMGVDMPNVSAQIQTDFATIAMLGGQALSPLPTDGRVVVEADLLRVALDEAAGNDKRLDALLRLNLTHLAPLLGAAADDVFAEDVDWLSVFRDANAASEGAYIRLSQEGLYALADAAQKGQRAEAVIIAAMLLEKRALHDVSPSDSAQIAALLAQANLPKTAAGLRSEALLDAMMAHLLGQGEARY